MFYEIKTGFTLFLAKLWPLCRLMYLTSGVILSWRSVLVDILPLGWRLIIRHRGIWLSFTGRAVCEMEKQRAMLLISPDQDFSDQCEVMQLKSGVTLVLSVIMNFKIAVNHQLFFLHTHRRQKSIRTHGLEASKCPIKHSLYLSPFLFRGGEILPTALRCQLHKDTTL